MFILFPHICICQLWVYYRYPNKWFQDVTSNKQYYSLAAIYEGQLIGVIISTVRQRTHCSKEASRLDLIFYYFANATYQKYSFTSLYANKGFVVITQ